MDVQAERSRCAVLSFEDRHIETLCDLASGELAAKEIRLSQKAFVNVEQTVFASDSYERNAAVDAFIMSVKNPACFPDPSHPIRCCSKMRRSLASDMSVPRNEECGGYNLVGQDLFTVNDVSNEVLNFPYDLDMRTAKKSKVKSSVTKLHLWAVKKTSQVVDVGGYYQAYCGCM